MKKGYIMFTMANTNNLKEIQESYTQVSREGIKSKTEVDCVKPHILDQTKSVRKRAVSG